VSLCDAVVEPLELGLTTNTVCEAVMEFAATAREPSAVDALKIGVDKPVEAVP